MNEKLAVQIRILVREKKGKRKSLRTLSIRNIDIQDSLVIEIIRAPSVEELM